MIKLFVADLDGCISHPFQSPDWDALTEIRALNMLSQSDKTVPAFTICTGRPLPYVEAVAQWLKVRHPFIFESGGGVYDSRANRIEWAEAFDTETREIVAHLKDWMRREVIDRYEQTIPEFAKQTDVGLINPDPTAVKAMYEQVRDYVESKYERFEIHYTDVSVNVIMKESNKGAGVRQLSRLTGIGLNEMAYIGDGTNDIPALSIVGKSFAPINAREETKKVARVMEDEATRAVYAAYQQIIEWNREAVGSEQ